MRLYSAVMIFFSPTGSTAAVVRATARGMGIIDCREVDLTLPPARADFSGLCEEDVVLLGAPVHDGALPQALAQALSRLWAVGQPAVLCATYGGLGCGSALRDLHAVATKARLRPVAAGLFPSEHPLWPCRGNPRPGEGDLATARELGFDARFRLERGAAMPMQQSQPSRRAPCLPQRGWPLGTLRAVSPRRLLPVPEVTLACTGCGLCAQGCPTAAISMPDVDIDGDACLRCMRCVDVCPEGALLPVPGGLPGRLAAALRRKAVAADTVLL